MRFGESRGCPLTGRNGADPGQLQQVVHGADQRPLPGDVIEAPTKKLSETSSLLDLAENRLHGVTRNR